MPGGRRPGAGRKPGQKDKATRAQRFSVAEIAQRYTDEALAVLHKIMKDERAPAAARALCANSLLDRGYGKPTQRVEHELDPSKLTDEQLDALQAALDTARNPVAAFAQGAGGDRASKALN